MNGRNPTASLWAWLVFASWAVSAVVLACGDPAAEGGPADSDDADRQYGTPKVIFATALGAIVVEVFPDAAPNTVAHWLRLVEGKGLESGAIAKDGDVQPGGYYDGLAFSYTKPHVEIVTASRGSEDEGPHFETELDARSLGLDRDVIENYAEAMRVLQWELIRAHGKMGKGKNRPALLAEWIDLWHETDSAGFLIGVPRQRINEAQGYVYRDGLRSLPVDAGAVALKPLSPIRTSARLSIALSDMPQRTGKWMVIGRVVEGLEVAEKISIQTLKGQGTPEVKRFEPLEPVVITGIEIRTEGPQKEAPLPEAKQPSPE